MTSGEDVEPLTTSSLCIAQALTRRTHTQLLTAVRACSSALEPKLQQPWLEDLRVHVSEGLFVWCAD